MCQHSSAVRYQCYPEGNTNHFLSQGTHIVYKTGKLTKSVCVNIYMVA